MKLRDYQQEALDRVISNFKSGVSNQLIVLPTGSGKTVIIAAILKHFGEKSLVIAHRKELIRQNTDTIGKFCGTEIGMYSHGQKDLKKDIVVGSIQSCCKDIVISKLKKKEFKILVIDEAHHSNAKSYQKIIKQLQFSRNDSNLLVGFTATPNLAGGNNLLETYSKISYSKNIDEMITKNFLSKINGIKIKTEIILDDVGLVNGDFSLNVLSGKINTLSRNMFITRKFKQHAEEKAKSIAFCATISHARDLRNAFRKCGIKSEYIYGKTSDKNREKIFNDLRNGKIKVLTSVGVLTEGFDMPEINTIIMARPTKSRSLYIQMIGRGLRTHIDKKKCLVLDFTDEDHSLKQTLRLDLIIKNLDYKTDYKHGDKTEIPLNILRNENSGLLVEISEDYFDIVNGTLKEQIITEKKSISLKDLTKSERAIESFRIKLKFGEIVGKAPYGYLNVKATHWRNHDSNVVIDKFKEKIVKEIFELYATNSYSMRDISIKLDELYKNNNEFKSISKEVISLILKNKFYIGINKYKGKEYNHKYETFISKKLFYSAQNRKITSNIYSQKNNILYRSLFTCKECNSLIRSDYKRNKKLTYYSCKNGKHTKYVNEKIITSAFKSEIKKIELHDDTIKKIVQIISIKDSRIDYLYIKSLINTAYLYFSKASIETKRNIVNNIFTSFILGLKEVKIEINPIFKNKNHLTWDEIKKIIKLLKLIDSIN